MYLDVLRDVGCSERCWMYGEMLDVVRDARLDVLRCRERGIGRSNHYLPAHPLHSVRGR